MRLRFMLTFTLTWVPYVISIVISDVRFDFVQSYLVPNETFLNKHSTASVPVEYWGPHPYELQGQNQRNLQFSPDDQYRNMLISLQNDVLNSYSQANPSKAAKISYIVSTLLPKASSIWSNALKVYPSKSFNVLNPVSLIYICD
jgi:hypothetical protein